MKENVLKNQLMLLSEFKEWNIAKIFFSVYQNISFKLCNSHPLHGNVLFFSLEKFNRFEFSYEEFQSSL